MNKKGENNDSNYFNNSSSIFNPIKKDSIKEISKEILNGKIDLKPYYKDKKTPCQYCNYRNICRFNMGGCTNKYNYINKTSKEEILNKIKMKGE